MKVEKYIELVFDNISKQFEFDTRTLSHIVFWIFEYNTRHLYQTILLAFDGYYFSS
jgi:hypothetical protein